MKISLSNIGKRFQKHWVFRGINYEFTGAASYALLGHNGSGKSTLLRVMAGMQAASEGNVAYNTNGNTIEPSRIFRHISFAAPGQELVEELSLREFLDFHFSFKMMLEGFTVDKIIELTGLQSSANKPIADYSSGMKQRVKLAQAIFTDSDVLLLDEPCSNLDEAGVQQYRDWMEKYSNARLVVVASNDVREYYFCKERIELSDYK